VTGAASASTLPRRILLVDCDMFFVQVARLEDPDGAGRERILLVGGSSSGRGVVTSASYEARAFGVRSGMPTAQALRLCPQAVVVPVPRGACARKSRAINDTLRRLAPVVQGASIDEFYLDMSGTERLLGEELAETARRIRETVLEETEISVSVGGGTSRVVSKLAVRRAKPAGVLVVAPGEEEAFVRTHALDDLPGVGPAFAEELKRRGLVRVEDALGVDPEWLESWLGAGRAAWLRDRMRGIDLRPFWTTIPASR
jgi:DNA polymerase IV